MFEVLKVLIGDRRCKSWLVIETIWVGRTTIFFRRYLIVDKYAGSIRPDRIFFSILCLAHQVHSTLSWLSLCIRWFQELSARCVCNSAFSWCVRCITKSAVQCWGEHCTVATVRSRLDSSSVRRVDDMCCVSMSADERNVTRTDKILQEFSFHWCWNCEDVWSVLKCFVDTWAFAKFFFCLNF